MPKPNKSIEEIFSVQNIDQDCNRIATLMLPFQKQINSELSSGDNISAIALFLELLVSTAYHFVEDEHWCYFDDYYSPDYLCAEIFNTFQEAINANLFSSLELDLLRAGLQKVSDMDSVENYCYPSVEKWLEAL